MEFHRIAQPATRNFGFSDRVNFPFSETWRQRQKQPGRGQGIAKSGMAVLYRHAQPFADHVHTEIRQRFSGKLSQQPGVEGARLAIGKAGSLAFGADNRQVKTDRMADHQSITDQRQERLQAIGDGRGVCDISIANVVDRRRLGRNRLARINEHGGGIGLVDLALDERDGTNLNDPRRFYVQSGGFQIDDDGIDGDQRNGAGPKRHGGRPAAVAISRPCGRRAARQPGSDRRSPTEPMQVDPRGQ